MEDSDHLNRLGGRIINNYVVGISLNSPEAEGKSREILAYLAAQGFFGDEGAGIVDGTFHTISGFGTVTGNVSPQFKEIGPKPGA